MNNNKTSNLILLLIISIVINCSKLLGSDRSIYLSQVEKSAEQVTDFSKTRQSICRYLAYRDIPSFIAKHVSGTKTLDYGTGTGFSVQFLLDQNLDVAGVDVSKEMLKQAMDNCPSTPFYLMQNGCIPLESNTYNLVFSCFVFFELGTPDEIMKYLEEAKRVMKDDGIFIAVTGSQDMYSKDWYIINADFPENRSLNSGDLAKIYLYDSEIEFTNYYWSEKDFRHLFHQAGLQLIEIHYPKGKEGDGYPWKDEMTSSPFVVFVARKG